MGRSRNAPPPQFLTDMLTLFQPKGDYAHPITNCPLPLDSNGSASQFESMDDENAEIFNIYMVKNCASPGLKLLLSLYEYNKILKSVEYLNFRLDIYSSPWGWSFLRGVLCNFYDLNTVKSTVLDLLFVSGAFKGYKWPLINNYFRYLKKIANIVTIVTSPKKFDEEIKAERQIIDNDKFWACRL